MRNSTFYQLLFTLLLFTFSFSLYAQHYGCGMPDNPPPANNTSGNSSSNQNTQCSISTTAFPSEYDINVIPNNPNQKLKIHLNFIFVQRADGALMFTMGNSDHNTFFTNIMTEMNRIVSNLDFQDACADNVPPKPTCPDDFVPNLQIEFIPHFTEIQNTFYWNHENDPQPNTFYSAHKPFLKEIVDLAKLEDTYYSEGFDLIYTTHGPGVEGFANNPTIPMWNQPDFNESYVYNGGAVAYSMRPTASDKNLNMQLHMPQSYHGYINLLTIDVWSLCWEAFMTPELYAIDEAEGLLHEIMHGLGIEHSSSCNDPDNIGLGNGCTRDGLNGCQINTIWNRLMTTNLRNIVDCSEADMVTYEVNEDMTWSNDLNLYGDVVVDNNSTLTVTCNLHFSENRSIVVKQGSKLIIDGALLTSINDCEEKWQGIIVEGDNNEEYDVIVKTGSVIENAHDAVSLPNNGSIRAYNAIFQDNTRDIEFISSFRSRRNNSLITNCDFYRANRSITNWNVNKVKVRNSRFHDIEETSIYSGAGSFILEWNNFVSGMEDIYMTNAQAIESWRIFDNEFYAPIGILSKGGSLSNHKIEKNIFNNQERGIFMDGISRFECLDNEMNDNETGVLAISTFFSNPVKGNSFTECTTGIDYLGSNIFSTFTENCFTQSREDVYISGEVNENIGTPNLEAGNCFSDDQNDTGFNDPNQGIPGIIGNHEFFEYYKFEDNNENCKDVDQTSFFSIEQSSGKQDACQDGDGPDGEHPWPLPPRIPSEFPSPLSNIQDVEDAISDLFAFKLEINDGEMEQSMKELAQNIIDSKIDQFSLQLSEHHLSNENYDSARSAVGSIQSKYKLTFILAIDLYEQDFVKAQSTLALLDPNDTEFQDFKRTQQINIRFLSLGKEAIEQIELNELYSIGLKSHPLSGYARGLYSYLTDERFTSEIPVHDQIQNRNSDKHTISSALKKEFTVTPNFTSSDFSIKSKGYSDCNYLIYDIYGNELINEKLKENHIINVGTWAIGTYIVSVKEKGHIVLTKKIVVVR